MCDGVLENYTGAMLRPYCDAAGHETDQRGLAYVEHDELVEAAEAWGKLVADRGYDVVGDLGDLVPVRPAASSDPARASYDDRVDILAASLTEAVAEVGRLRERLAAAEQRAAKTERKRRRLLAG